MNYVAYAFSVDFAKYPRNGGVKHVVEYLPFDTLAVAGPFLRLAASEMIGEHRPRAKSIALAKLMG